MYIRFTLKNLLFACVVTALILAWWHDHQRLAGRIQELEKRDQVVTDLIQAGTAFTFDEYGRPITAKFQPRTCTDREVGQLRYLPTIREVELRYCFRITDKATEYLAELPDLRHLRLSLNNRKDQNDITRGFDLTKMPRITDKSLENVRRIRTLEYLSLFGNEFSGEAILKLSSLSNLKYFESPRDPRTKEAVDKLCEALPDLHAW